MVTILQILILLLRFLYILKILLLNDFHNYPPSSFQHHTLPPNSLPPSNSTYLFNPPSSQPLQMTPSVPFASLSDPIKLFDGLDHTYLPEKVLAHLNAHVTLQLGPQFLDIQSYLT